MLYAAAVCEDCTPYEDSAFTHKSGDPSLQATQGICFVNAQRERNPYWATGPLEFTRYNFTQHLLTLAASILQHGAVERIL